MTPEQRRELLTEMALLFNQADSYLIREARYVESTQSVHFRHGPSNRTQRLRVANLHQGRPYELQKELNQRVYNAQKELRSRHEEEFKSRVNYHRPFFPKEQRDRPFKLAYKDLTRLHPDEWAELYNQWVHKPLPPKVERHRTHPDVVGYRYDKFKKLRSKYEVEFYTLYEEYKSRFPNRKSNQNYTAARNKLIENHREEYLAQ